MMRNGEYIGEYLRGVKEITEKIDRASLDHAVELLWEAWQRGATVFTCGNGGSAGTATHLAADLFKCTIVPRQPRLRVMSLGDNVPLMSALVNDEGWENVYVRQLETLFRPGDLLIAISVHGGSGRDRAGLWSQNLLRAMEYAKQHGGQTIGLAGFTGGAMRQLADAAVVVPYHTTPHVESFHVVIHHLLTFCLAERIRAGAERRRANAASAVSR
jgi:D-sedoheptulose 7-phosphate isomerase